MTIRAVTFEVKNCDLKNNTDFMEFRKGYDRL